MTILRNTWKNLHEKWFATTPEIMQYHLLWSSRKQTRTLASLNAKTKKVFVARELNYPKHWIWLEPLLYHEMCHAYLAIPGNCDECYTHHGKAFKSLEKRHPLIEPFDQWIKNHGFEAAIKSDRTKRHCEQKATWDNITCD